MLEKKKEKLEKKLAKKRENEAMSEQMKDEPQPKEVMAWEKNSEEEEDVGDEEDFRQEISIEEFEKGIIINALDFDHPLNRVK